MENKKSTTGANGAAQNGTTTTTAATSTANGKETKRAENPKAEQPKIESKAITLDQQRERANTLNALFEKESKLNESRMKLKEYKLSADEHSNTLTLRDAKGAEFKTGNPAIVQEVIQLIQKNLEVKITEVQSQILAA